MIQHCGLPGKDPRRAILYPVRMAQSVGLCRHNIPACWVQPIFFSGSRQGKAVAPGNNIPLWGGSAAIVSPSGNGVPVAPVFGFK